MVQIIHLAPWPWEGLRPAPTPPPASAPPTAREVGRHPLSLDFPRGPPPPPPCDTLVTVGVALSRKGRCRLTFVAAAVLNASTWLAAILFGRTRQLRSGWFMVVALLVAMGAAATIWPEWGRDVDIVMAAAGIALGFPASCILFVVFRHPLPWGLQRASSVIGPLSVLGISYVQAFVLLPLLFRWRAGKATPPERSDAE